MAPLPDSSRRAASSCLSRSLLLLEGFYFSMEPALYCRYSLACPFSSLTEVSFPQDWNKDALEPQTPRRKDVHTRERKNSLD